VTVIVKFADGSEKTTLSNKDGCWTVGANAPGPAKATFYAAELIQAQPVTIPASGFVRVDAAVAY
jgi:hypothetical protein